MTASLDALREEARSLDRGDPLARFRGEFVFDEESPLYLDGNSLGRLPMRTAPAVERTVRAEWGSRLVRGWNEGWVDAPGEWATSSPESSARGPARWRFRTRRA